MKNSLDWMLKNHPRPRIPHDSLYLLFHFLFIAVNGALFTRGFIILIGAFLQPLPGVVMYPLAILAKSPGLMMVEAIKPNHACDGFLLPGKSAFFHNESPGNSLRPTLYTVNMSDSTRFDVCSISFVCIDMHSKYIIRVNANKHITKDQFPVAFDANPHPVFITQA